MENKVTYTTEPFQKVKDLVLGLYSGEWGFSESPLVPDDSYLVYHKERMIIGNNMNRLVFGIFGVTEESVTWLCTFILKRIYHQIDNYGTFQIKFKS